MNHANLYESPKAGGRQLRTMATLLPYLWPAGNWSMRRRVVFAFALMIASRIANVYVPLFYKDAMDMLTGEGNLAIALPLGLLLLLRGRGRGLRGRAGALVGVLLLLLILLLAPSESFTCSSRAARLKSTYLTTSRI